MAERPVFFIRGGKVQSRLYAFAWFPGFAAYAVSNELVKKPKRLYFSLGDAESKTKNPYLKTVQSRTEELEAFYRKQGIETTFCRNTGGHFKDTDQRMAAGILWLLSKLP